MDYTVNITDRLLRFDCTSGNWLVTLLPFAQTPNAPYELHKISTGDGHAVTIRTDPSTSDFLLPDGTTSIVLNDASPVAYIKIPAEGQSPAYVNLGGGTGGGGGGGGGLVFTVATVTASEVGPKYQDEKQGLHTVLGIIPVLDTADFTSPRTVTLWLDHGDGKVVFDSWHSLTAAGQVIRIGDPTLATEGVRESGGIYVPTDPSKTTWRVWCAAGHLDQGVDVTPFAHASFTVQVAGVCSPTGTTNAQFVADPGTGNPILYSYYDPGIWRWAFYELTWTPPTLALEPSLWFSLFTVQKGATIGGVWTPAPDYEGGNDDPTGQYLGRNFMEVTQVPTADPTAVVVMKRFGTNPATWTIPPAQNADLSTNLYTDYRFLIYNVSRLGTDTSGSGGSGTYTLQTTCWPGGTDHGILTPNPQAYVLDIRAANPLTIALPLIGGNGQALTVGPSQITSGYMAHDAVTAANHALAAGAVVDTNVHDVSVAKFTAGTCIFTGDVILSRGVGLPVLVLQNTGLTLFGQADASTGATGLLSKPYVQIQSSGVKLNNGLGGSMLFDAASNTVTIWSLDGDKTKPYFALNQSALTFIDQPDQYALLMNAAGLQIVHGLNSDGTVASNANQIVVTASALQMKQNGVVRVTMDGTGTTVSDGGANSVQLRSTGVTIASTGAGTMAMTGTALVITDPNGGTVTMNSSGVKVAASGGAYTVMDTDGVRAISGVQCVRIAGAIGVQVWAQWNESTKTGDTTKPYIGLEASTGNVFLGSNAHLLTLSGGQMSFSITGQTPTTVINNNSITTGAAGVVPFVLTCTVFATAGSIAGYREETINGTTYKVALYNL